MIEPEEKTTSEEKPVTDENTAKVEETVAEGQATENKTEEIKEPGNVELMFICTSSSGLTSC